MIKSAHILLYNSKREILLQLRDDKPGIWYPGQWGLLGGGIGENETPQQGLVRELKEELPNFDIKNIRFMGNLNNREYLLYMFKGEINENEIELNKKLTEGQCVKYFKIDEIYYIRVPKIFQDFILNNKEKICI